LSWQPLVTVTPASAIFKASGAVVVAAA